MKAFKKRIIGFSLLLIPFISSFFLPSRYEPITQSPENNNLVFIILIIFAFLGFGSMAPIERQSPELVWEKIFCAFAVSFPVYFTLTNLLNQGFKQLLGNQSLLNYCGCLISMIIALVRIGPILDSIVTLYFSLVYTSAYVIIQFSFRKLQILDSGFALKVFFFSALFSTLCFFCLTKLLSSPDQNQEQKQIAFSSLRPIGSIIIVIFFPFLLQADLRVSDKFFSTRNIDSVISINMWFSLFASIISTFNFTVIFHKKLTLKSIATSVFTGGIVYSSVSHISFNLGISILIGFLTGLVNLIFQAYLYPKFNLRSLNTMFLPSLFTLVILTSMIKNINFLELASGYENKQSDWCWTAPLIVAGVALAGAILTVIPFCFKSNQDKSEGKRD